MTEKIEKHEAELNDLKLKLSEVERSREDDLRSYQRMVRGFLRAFKSEARRILQSQRSDLDFFELERVTPTDLAKVAKEEEAAKKSASKQRKKLKRKTASEKPHSECPLEPSLLLEGSSAEAGAEADECALALNDQLIDADLVAPESGTDV